MSDLKSALKSDQSVGFDAHMVEIRVSSVDGLVRLSQFREEEGPDPQVILVSPDQVALLIQWIESAAAAAMNEARHET